MSTPKTIGIHTLAATISEWGIELQFVCHDPNADCHLLCRVCDGVCDEWTMDPDAFGDQGEPLCYHCHRVLTHSEKCNAVEWLNEMGWDDRINSYNGPNDAPLPDGPVIIEWEDGGYVWSYIATPQEGTQMNANKEEEA